MPTLPTLDVSGGPGRSAADGANGYDGSGSGGHGGPAGDAGPASPGVPSGDIDVTLTSPRDGTIAVWGALRLANGASTPFNQELSTSHQGAIQLVARGGHGGHGGRGGRGGDGARGRSGADATRYSSGGNGGPGGDGGAGGVGSHGAPGGNGGRITVNLGDADTHLLMLVTHAVGAGRGGRAGANGDGGSGGPGGRGGSSYSWTETDSYTDSQGRSQTRTRHRSNSGGFSGSSGRSGPPGTAALFAGADGVPGKLRILVRDASGVVTKFARRYELALVSFAFDNDNKDGVFEPDEHVTISRIVVQNVGGMPTPTRAPVIYLNAGPWVVPDETTLRLPRPLAPGESIELDGQLGFKIALHQPSGPSDPLASDASIDLGAWIPAANRTFGDFAQQITQDLRSFKVTFPAMLSRLDGAFALAVGERSRVAFAVRNVSSLALGAASTTRRVVSYHLQLKPGEIAADNVSFHDAAGAPVRLDAGYSGGFDTLPPGGDAQVSGTMEFAAQAVPYTAARLWVTLGLGRLHLPEDVRHIQVQELVVRVAERFKPNARAEALLVVQNRTTRDEITAWRAVAEAFGIELAKWDLSLEGHLDLLAPVTGGPLATQFARKPIIVLDAAFDTSTGERRPSKAIDPSQALDVGQSGGQIVLVGQPQLASYALVPDVVRGVASQPGLDHAVAAVSALEVEGHARFELQETSWFFTQTEEDLARAAAKLAKKLDRALPSRRHVVIHTYDGEVTGSTFRMKQSVGTIDVMRTIDVGARATCSVAASDVDVHDASLVETRLGPIAFAFHLPLATRLRVILGTLPRTRAPLLGPGVAPGADRAGMAREAGSASDSDGLGADAALDDPFAYLEVPSGKAPTAAELLCASIAADVVCEIATWVERPRLVDRGERDDDPALPALSALAALDLGGAVAIEADSPLGLFLVETIALARAVAWNHVSALEVIPPLLFFRRRPKLYFRVRSLADRLLDRAFPKADVEANARRRAAKLALKKAFARLDDLGKEAGAKKSVMLHEVLRAWLAPLGLELRDTLQASFVLVGEEHATLVATRERQRDRRARLHERHQRDASARAQVKGKG